MELIFSCVVPVAVLLLGLAAGSIGLHRRERRLRDVEARLLTLPVTDTKQIPPGINPTGTQLVMGSIVIATDAFRAFLAGLRMLIGGEVRSYDRLMHYARREAICRMMQQAHDCGAAAVINVRIETSTLAGVGRRAQPRAEVIVYGTAVLARPATPST